MFHITVNNKYKHKILIDKNHIQIDDLPTVFDIVGLENEMFHVIKDTISYNVTLISIDYETKTCIIRVNKTNYTVEVKDRFDDLLHQLGMDNLTNKIVNDIKAPMPGLVLKVLVEDGQQIKKGDNLLVLEAMKMENIIKAPADGMIKSIKVSASDKVEKNQILINMV